MVGKSPVRADAEQRSALVALSHSRDRGEADRARAILLTLSGWTSGQIAQAFGVREDTGRLWRSAFMMGGIEARKKSTARGPAPVKAERALVGAEDRPLLWVGWPPCAGLRGSSGRVRRPPEKTRRSC